MAVGVLATTPLFPRRLLTVHETSSGRAVLWLARKIENVASCIIENSVKFA